MKALRTITLRPEKFYMQRLSHFDWEGPELKIDHFKRTPAVCNLGPRELVDFPVDAKQIHVSFYQYRPRSGAWFTLYREGDGVDWIVLKEIEPYGTAELSVTPFNYTVDLFICSILDKHKLKKVYAVVEWS